MKTKNFKFSVLMVSALTLGVVSCKKEGCTDSSATNYSEKAKKDDGSCTYATVEPVEVANTVVTGTLTTNTTWSSSIIYEIKGKVIVPSGVTLTIEAGTIIKGQEGSDVNATALIVARGGKINAVGTAAKPIIFTSVLDNIKIGEMSGTSLDESDAGKWGGVIILGNAPVSAADGDTQGQIEGIPATESYGTYGGTSSGDDSGMLTYVSIRHCGALIGAGNEINGLTLGAVGSGTTISNVEVVSTLDDGIEIFGGTVNVSNVLIYFQQDDAVDIDQNYAGTVTNFYTVNGPDSDKGLEIDGPENTTNTGGKFTLTNGTCSVAAGGYATGDFKSKAQGTVNNVVFGTAKISSSFDGSCGAKTDAYVNLTATPAKLAFTGSSFTSTLVYTSSTTCTIPTNYQGDAEALMISSSAATGANKTAFQTWTWTSIKGRL